MGPAGVRIGSLRRRIPWASSPASGYWKMPVSAAAAATSPASSPRTNPRASSRTRPCRISRAPSRWLNVRSPAWALAHARAAGSASQRTATQGPSSGSRKQSSTNGSGGGPLRSVRHVNPKPMASPTHRPATPAAGPRPALPCRRPICQPSMPPNAPSTHAIPKVRKNVMPANTIWSVHGSHAPSARWPHDTNPQRMAIPSATRPLALSTRPNPATNPSLFIGRAFPPIPMVRLSLLSSPS